MVQEDMRWNCYRADKHGTFVSLVAYNVDRKGLVLTRRQTYLPPGTYFRCLRADILDNPPPRLVWSWFRRAFLRRHGATAGRTGL